jgi:hypothetical protein
MSKLNFLPDETPIASYEDVTEFLTVRATFPCPACGNSDWSVYTSNEATGFTAGVGLVALNLETAGTIYQGMPAVMVTCRKCFFIRMHHLGYISKWAAGGKPDFVENE